MKTVLQFFAALIPNFERSRIVEDVDMLRLEVKDNLLPAFQAAATLTHGKTFASKLAANFNEVFALTLPEYKRQGYFGGMAAFYAALGEKLDLIDKMIPDLFAKDVTRESMTYRKAAVLQYLAAVRFINEYSSRALLRLLAAEQNAQLKNDAAIDSQLAPAEIRWLDENQASYMQTLKLLAIPVKDLASALGQIPEITIVPEKFHALTQTVGIDKLDPMRMGLISANWNPIYHLRSLFVERQVQAYQRNKELKRALELRVLALKQAYAGTQDAKLQSQIEYIEGRIQTLSHTIQEMERQYT